MHACIPAGKKLKAVRKRLSACQVALQLSNTGKDAVTAELAEAKEQV